MTVIVIHAGMPKAGSSSIQQWLQANSADLRGQGITVVFAPPNERGAIDFVPFESGPINSSWIVDGAVGRPAEKQEKKVDALMDALAAAAERYGNVVVSGESFAHPFWSLHAATLAGFQGLSSGYDVRVAYYARPQHTALEAAWRQWGYRSDMRPSAYVEHRAAYFHYASTRKGVRSLAPGLQFEPRPFREDMLESGDLVVDFAARFLGIEAAGGVWANPGLPLEVVNVLAAAPAGMFWDRSYGNERMNRIKRLLADQPLPEDDRVGLSRQILCKYAHERFQAENAELGWHDFVPLPEDPDGTPGIESLDRLWAPQASPTELSLLFRALRAAV